MSYAQHCAYVLAVFFGLRNTGGRTVWCSVRKQRVILKSILEFQERRAQVAPVQTQLYVIESILWCILAVSREKHVFHICLCSELIISLYFCSGSGCPSPPTPCSCPSVKLIKPDLSTVMYTGKWWLGSVWRKGCASWLKCLCCPQKKTLTMRVLNMEKSCQFFHRKS